MPECSSLASREQSPRTLVEMRPQSPDSLLQGIQVALSHAAEYTRRLDKWQVYLFPAPTRNHRLIRGDARVVLPTLASNSVQFVVTSPPYWSILTKKPDHKAQERVRANLATVYSDDESDLGNITDYTVFLEALTNVLLECARVLQVKRYMAIVVSDFRHGSRFYPFHSDLIVRLDRQAICAKSMLTLQGIKVLLQNHKSLKPYGYPFAYVENVHHQYVLIFQKQKVGH